LYGGIASAPGCLAALPEGAGGRAVVFDPELAPPAVHYFEDDACRDRKGSISEKDAKLTFSTIIQPP
jgi:hypothetical protein